MNGRADRHHYLSLLFLLYVEALQGPWGPLTTLDHRDARERLGFLWFHLNAAAFFWVLPGFYISALEFWQISISLDNDFNSSKLWGRHSFTKFCLLLPFFGWVQWWWWWWWLRGAVSPWTEGAARLVESANYYRCALESKLIQTNALFQIFPGIIWNYHPSKISIPETVFNDNTVILNHI